MSTCLDVAELRRIAAQHGDQTRYAIHRRTGLPQSTIYRTFAASTEPSMATLRRIASAYGVPLTALLTDAAVGEAA